jgi:tetratricopeptide (TPR) repeat protein
MIENRRRIRESGLWKWGWSAAGVLLLAAAVALTQFRPRVPEPPVVPTAGFDPAIAEAIAQARAAAQSSPRSAEARGHLGMVLLAHDVRIPAAECFQQATRLNGTDPRWPYLLGVSQLPDDPAAAALSLERAARIVAPEELAPRLKLADTLLQLGRTAQAEAAYRLILERHPQLAPARLGLGKVAIAKGATAEAANWLAGASQDPCTRKAACRLLLGAYQRLGRTADAEQTAQALAQLPPDQPYPDPILAEVQQLKTGEAAWVERADDWIRSGRVREAAQLLEQTVQAYPKSDRAMFMLGRARLRLQDPVGAEAILRRATELAPGSVEAQVQLGVVQLTLGHNQDAQRSFRAAIQANQTLPEAWYNLGLSLGAENHAEALKAFRQAIRLKPTLAEAYLAMAVVLRADGDGEAAATALKDALALNPPEPLRTRLLEQLRLTRVKTPTPLSE